MKNKTALEEGFLDAFIPSKDTRVYLKQIGHQFSEREKAMILANHAMLTPAQKVEWLSLLQEMVSEDALKRRIEEELQHWKKEAKEDNDLHWFESPGALYEFVFIPHDFRHGDVVQSLLDDGQDEIGAIIDYSEKEYEFNKNLHGDYSDVQICVDTRFRGTKYLGEFSHEHVNPIYVERVQLPESDDRLGYLKYLFQTCENAAYPKRLREGLTENQPGGRTADRIPAVMRVLEEVWSKNPDLRLGQLICAAAQKQDVFSLEDDKLMDGLWQVFLTENAKNN